MYEKFANQVSTFHDVFSCRLPSRNDVRNEISEIFHIPKEQITDLQIDFIENLYKQGMFGKRLGLMVEEMGEWAEAFMKEKSQSEQDKELADLLYVTIGTADTMANANFTKDDGGLSQVYNKNQIKINNPETMKRGKNGKILKPEDIEKNYNDS